MSRIHLFRAPLGALLVAALTATGTAGLSAQAATPTPTIVPKATETATHTAQATPTHTAQATPTPTVKPVKAAISVTPATVNRGGLVTVSGANFEPKETITLYFTETAKITTTATADANGLLPATGVTVPYKLKPGPHTLVVMGDKSKRVATATVTVQALTPKITLSAASAKPGDKETVTGSGFGTKERVTLALNGAALVTDPAVITTTNGGFTAAFTVPTRILDGPNTVSAVGNRSRVTAVAQFTGSLPTASEYYFAGGLNTATDHSFVDLLNPNRQPAKVTMTFYFDNGQTEQQTANVGPTSEKVVSVAGFGYPAGTYGLSIAANRHIYAQINMTRDGKDGDNLLGNTGLGTTWYLAEGYTGLTFHESVSVLNPDQNTPASVQLRVLPLGGGAAKTVTVNVPPHYNKVTDINSIMPSKSVSIIATSDHPVVVERTLTFSNNGFGLTTRAGTNEPATTWLFAEGTTTTRFQTFLTILNPNNAPAQVTASFFGSNGNPLGSRTLTVAPLSRGNIKLNDVVHASGIASVVTSDLPVVVERPEYFGSPNAPGIPGSDVFGRNGAAPQWSFPGGDTKPGKSSEFLLVYNPSPVPITINATFYGTNGSKVTKQVTVQPTVRGTININTLIPKFDPTHGAVLKSTSGQGFIAEQTVFAPNFSSLRSTQGIAQ